MRLVNSNTLWLQLSQRSDPAQLLYLLELLLERTVFSRQPHPAASVQVRQIYKYTVENLCDSNVLRKVEVVSKWVMLWEVSEPGF